MDIVKATASYEKWLGGHTKLVPADLKRKHRLMADRTDPFPFFRGTFYRWAQRWQTLGADLCGAPAVLAVGDIHIENFGTWRDAEGRLAWGVNDFDEAAVLPYTQDLVRLAASAAVEARQERLSLSVPDICETVASGYRGGLKRRRDGTLRPTLLDGDRRWLAPPRTAAEARGWWRRLERDLTRARPVPRAATAALRATLPRGAEVSVTGARAVGVGSLGKPRFAALAQWQGGPISREVKALVPSAVCWATGEERPPALPSILARAVRSPDPHFQVCGGWVCRRIAPDIERSAFVAGQGNATAARLLEAMGRELACVHDGDAAAVLADLARRPRKWLRKGVATMLSDVLDDWAAWRRKPGDRR
jgi:hypothetical protein